ncbi:unnamed protein product (mitochondrion) [Plasmodiophora brassicae]|uniref:Uncharacterized protein n=1 Tax=Plasmodiophora brassicae TaxID=37360 RepID=A0A3P3Y552_PLABS|nr:unnamed protein product [Plasmodiophora brassicae]
MVRGTPYLDGGAGSSLSVTSMVAPESAVKTRVRSGTARSTGAHGDGRDATSCTDLDDAQAPRVGPALLTKVSIKDNFAFKFDGSANLNEQEVQAAYVLIVPLMR